MEAYAKALLWAIPGFLVLVIFEVLYGHFKKKQTYTLMDTISSLSSGISNTIKDSLGLAVVLVSYPFFLKHLAITSIPSSIWVFIIAFICIDFASYWSHRLNHKINIFWNQHVIHHSSEEFNLACALRQSISNIIGFNAIFLIPAAIFGIAPEVINILAPLHLFGQFWYHTRHIGKLGFLEYIFVTPSQHRVHHAINPIYIDKNLAAIFSVWDRLFGTFQEELDSEPPIFGTLKPVSTWNPIWINFIHLWGLIKDAFYTQKISDKFKIWFMPTGWRPKDVSLRFPRKPLEDVSKQLKYNPPATIFTKTWVLLQHLGTTSLLLFLLANFENLDFIQKLGLGGIVMMSIFSFSTVMDGRSWAIHFDVIRNCIGILLLLIPDQGILLKTTLPSLYWFAMGYFTISLVSLIPLDSQLSLKTA